MNQSVFYKALVHIKTKYSLICSLSLNTYNFIAENKYTDVSLMVAFEKRDYLVIKNIIHLIQDKNILDQYIFSISKTYHDVVDAVDAEIKLEIIKLMIDYRSNTMLNKITELISEYRNNIGIFEYIVKSNIELKNKEQILRISCIQKKLDIFKLFFDESSDGNSLLNLACNTNKYDVVKYLLQKGIVPDFDMLINTCKFNHLLIVKLLIEHGSFSDEQKTNALYQAMISENYNIVALLIEYKVSIPPKNICYEACSNERILDLTDKHRKLN